jgi:hypothetical protein
MTQLVVDDAQAKLISESREGIEIRDRNGNHLGYVAQGFSDEDIVFAEKRASSAEHRYTTQEVISYLQALDKQ